MGELLSGLDFSYAIYPGSMRFILARATNPDKLSFGLRYLSVRRGVLLRWRRGGGAAGSLGTRGGGGCRGKRRANSVLAMTV